MSILNRFFLVLVLILTISPLTACSSPEDDKQAHYTKAMEYKEAKDNQAAILELRNAIKIDAKFAAARYQLGLLYLEENEPKKAFGEIVRSADLAPENLDANLKTAEFYLIGRKKEESRKYLDRLLEVDPSYKDGLALLANLELIDGKFDDALAALEKIGPGVEEDYKLLNIRGRIFGAKKEFDNAEDSFVKAISADKSQFNSYRTLLAFYQSQGKKDKAKEVLDAMLKEFPDNPQTHLMLAKYYAAEKKVDLVEKELKKVVEIAPESSQARLQLVRFYLSKGDFKQAEETLVTARKELEDSPDIGTELASLYFNQGKFDDAKRIFDELQTASPGHGGTKLLQARFMLKDGKIRDAITIMQGLNNDFPKWAEPYFQLGLAHLRLGEVDLAQHAIATAIETNKKEAKYRTLMAQLLLMQGSFEECKKQAIEAVRLNPKNVRAALILSRARIGAKEYDKAVTLLSKLNEMIPGKKEILGNLALAYIGNGEVPTAEETLANLLEIAPGDTQAVSLLTRIRYKDDLAGAERFIRNQLEKAPESSSLYLMLGTLLASRDKTDEALAMYEKARQLNPDNLQAYISTGRLLNRIGERDKAMVMYQTMIEKQPNSIPGYMGTAALLEAEGKTAEAMDNYKKALEIKPDYAPAANNLAWLTVEEPDGDIGEALRLAMVAKQAAPEEPHITDTLGWVHYKRGSYSLAIPQFEMALQNKPDDPAMTYHLALALNGDEQKEKAKEVLEKLLKRDVTFTDRDDAAKLLAELKE